MAEMSCHLQVKKNMAALFNFLLQLNKVPFEDIWLGTLQVA